MSSKILAVTILLVALGVSQAIYSERQNSTIYCYSCNENNSICRAPFASPLLEDHLEPCTGECMKYKNPFDNNCSIV